MPAAEIGDAADQVADFPKVAVKSAGKIIAKPLRKQLKLDTGGDNRLSGIRNARLSVSARYKAKPGKYTGKLAAAPKRLAGPWRWLEDGTRPHATHNGRRQHPGSPGKRTWSRRLDAGIRDADNDIAARWGRVI